MKTDELIDMLSTNVEPVKGAEPRNLLMWSKFGCQSCEVPCPVAGQSLPASKPPRPAPARNWGEFGKRYSVCYVWDSVLRLAGREPPGPWGRIARGPARI